MLLSQVQVPPIVYLVGDGSIDARAKRRLGNQTVEPRKGLLEELAGPAQFRPWVAGPTIVPKISILCLHVFFGRESSLGLNLDNCLCLLELFRPHGS